MLPMPRCGVANPCNHSCPVGDMSQGNEGEIRKGGANRVSFVLPLHGRPGYHGAAGKTNTVDLIYAWSPLPGLEKWRSR